ncbi:MAG: peptidoglycan-binding protein [Chthoniobacterales bacterium]
MKRLVLIALSLSLVLPRLASADDKDKHQKEGNGDRHVQARNFAPRGGQVRVNRPHVNTNFSGNAQQFHTSAEVMKHPGLIRQGVARQRNLNRGISTPNVSAETNVVPQNQWNNNRVINRNGNNRVINRNGNNRVGQGSELAGYEGGDRHWDQGENGHGDRGRHWDQGENGRGDRDHHWDRDRHDRSWYRNHYSRFARFGGGYYYLNAGSWYPAYGYDPYFSSYTYDAPVYGYNDLDPGQVIANVQAELQQEGYYRGDLDGLFGPMTRRALINFQANNGLPVNGQIDEATLDALGLR